MVTKQSPDKLGCTCVGSTVWWHSKNKWNTMHAEKMTFHKGLLQNFEEIDKFIAFIKYLILILT